MASGIHDKRWKGTIRKEEIAFGVDVKRERGTWSEVMNDLISVHCDFKIVQTTVSKKLTTVKGRRKITPKR